MVKEYLVERYTQDFEHRLKQRAGDERRQLCDELIKSILETDSIEVFCALLREGMTRGVVSFSIRKFGAYGCEELHAALLDENLNVMRRAEKVLIFYSASGPDGTEVWNGGNMYRTCVTPVKELLMKSGEEATWQQLEELYRTRKSHVYRGGKCTCNRHGHSNDLPSFFAFGHDSLVSFYGTATREGQAEYQTDHPNCCGVAGLTNETDLQRAVDALAVRCARREECIADPTKLAAVIAEKMKLRRAGARNISRGLGDVIAQKQMWLPGKGYCDRQGKGKGKGTGKGKGKGKDKGDGSDDDSDGSTSTD